MEEKLLDLIEQSIPPGLSPGLQEEMRLELRSHLEMRLRDLALEGVSHEHAAALIISSFGSTSMIKEQLHNIHRFDRFYNLVGSFGPFFILFVLLQFFLGFVVINHGTWQQGFPPLFLLIYPITSMIALIMPLSWIGLVCSFAAYRFFVAIVYRGFPLEDRGKRALVAVACAVVGLWGSLMLSEQPVTGTSSFTGQEYVFARGGFPIVAFEYSTIAGPSLEQMLRFAADAFIWFFVGSVVGFLFPRRGILASYSSAVAVVVIAAFTLSGAVYFMLQFD